MGITLTGHGLAALRPDRPVAMSCASLEGTSMSQTSGGEAFRSDTWRNDGGFRPHASDPNSRPELFRGVLTRRFFAFLIDLVVLSIPVVLGVIFIALFGLLTLG